MVAYVCVVPYMTNGGLLITNRVRIRPTKSHFSRPIENVKRRKFKKKPLKIQKKVKIITQSINCLLISNLFTSLYRILAPLSTPPKGLGFKLGSALAHHRRWGLKTAIFKGKLARLGSTRVQNRPPFRGYACYGRHPTAQVRQTESWHLWHQCGK